MILLPAQTRAAVFMGTTAWVAFIIGNRWLRQRDEKFVEEVRQKSAATPATRTHVVRAPPRPPTNPPSEV